MKSDGMLAAQRRNQVDNSEMLRSAPPAVGPSMATGKRALSSEAAFAAAARLYDPRALTRAQSAALAGFLADRGAISDRDQLILQTDPTAGRMAVARDLAAPRDAIKDWQDRRAIDMERGRIHAVEASTRALALLGRISALRKHIADTEDPGTDC